MSFGSNLASKQEMIDVTLIILLVLFPVFTILIGWRLMYYYLSDDFSKGYYAGKIAFVDCEL